MGASGAGRRGEGREGPDGGRLDMTPLIDVTFLLIVFFLCLRFKTLEGNLAAFLPKDRGGDPRSAPKLEKLDLHVHLAEPGDWVRRGERKIWSGRALRWRLESQDYRSRPALEEGLRRFCRERRNPACPGEPLPLTVHAHPGVFYGEVAATVDLVKAAGFQEVLFGGGRVR